MDDRCPHCGAVPAVSDARFCDVCGGALSPAQEPALQPREAEPVAQERMDEPPPQPVDEPPPPPAPDGGGGRSRAARRFAPLAVGVAGLGLLIGGIVTAARGGDDRDLGSALRTGGVLLPSATSLPEVPSPPGTMADFVANEGGAGTTTTSAGEGAAIFAEDFADNEEGWLTGVTEDGTVTRSVVDGAYRVSVSPSDSSVLAYSWKPGFGSLADFSVELAAVSHGSSAAACGVGLLAEEDYPRVALLVDAVNGRFRAVARSSPEVPVEELIGWTESPTIERGAVNLIAMLFQDGDVFLAVNNMVVGRIAGLSFDPAQVAVVIRSAGGSEGGACDFDDLVVRQL